MQWFRKAAAQNILNETMSSKQNWDFQELLFILTIYKKINLFRPEACQKVGTSVHSFLETGHHMSWILWSYPCLDEYKILAFSHFPRSNPCTEEESVSLCYLLQVRTSTFIGFSRLNKYRVPQKNLTIFKLQ